VRGVGYYDNYDLTLVFNGHDRVVLKEYFDADHRLATIQFADGTQWDATTIIKRFGYHGTAGNDTLRACMLDETLAGGKGNDTFYLGRGTNTVLYNLGDG
jgi:Ca2+-binding RTX toxin-like protein